jgi:hypothetical protein
VKIAHFRTGEQGQERSPETIDALMQHAPGVAGVVSIHSMGLTTVLYDEQRTDPMRISDELVQAVALMEA